MEWTKVGKLNQLTAKRGTFILLLITQGINDQWSNIGPGSTKVVGGRTRALLVDGTTLYAAAVAGRI